MARRLVIRAGDLSAEAELNDSNTANEIWKILPIEGTANTWGDEIYFSIPANLQPENARSVVEEGDLGYWPPGTAFCIFFGRTPMSQGNEPRPASPVNVFGKIEGDPKVFKKVTSGAKVTVEAAQ
ncbi:MAG: cyclophilin-like fold protein [Chloroflexota bacterium]